MNYFDPNRPCIGYTPAFITEKGEGVIPLQFPQLIPQLYEGEIVYYKLLWNLYASGERNSFSQYSLFVTVEVLVETLNEYIENPELFLQKNFGFYFTLPTEKKKKSPTESLKGITLDDLM